MSERGGPVRILVGMAAGGGQDLYARVIAAHLGRHLPGSPVVTVENMPGAGGLIAAKYLAQRATPDGLTLGVIDSRAVLEQIVNDTPRFNVREFAIIGSPAADAVVCAFTRASGMTLDVWRQGRAPRLGMTGRESSGAAYTFLVAGAMQLPLRPVIGYGGTADIKAAMTSGEVDGLCMGRDSLLASFQPLQDYNIAIQVSSDEGDPLPGVSSANELVGASGRSRIDAVTILSRLARFLVVPPGAQDADVARLRDAFERTMSDPDFIASARAARLRVQPQTAASVEAAIRELLDLPPDVRRELRATMSAGNTQ